VTKASAAADKKRQSHSPLCLTRCHARFTDEFNISGGICWLEFQVTFCNRQSFFRLQHTKSSFDNFQAIIAELCQLTSIQRWHL